ncbi:MAG: MurR/RpiR family transcriptional regulator [Limnochordia bacterium]|nr:MurR/RpiR family transcriptional regulator [Limnochordia bacterium]
MRDTANAILHLRSSYPEFRPSERRLADAILKDPERIVHLSITELACEADVSDATIVKFCKRLGYKGFPDFKILLAQDVAVKPSPIYGQVELGDTVETVTEKIFQANITALQDTVRVLNFEATKKVVEAVSKAGEIQFYGIGASGLVALDAEQKFSRIGLRAASFIDGHTQVTRASLLKPGDVAVGISYSGETEEIIEALQTARSAGATTIAITNYSASAVVAVADLVLLTASQEDILRCGAISSRIAQLSTIDALFISVALVDFEQSQQSVSRTKEALSERRLVMQGA